MNEETYYLGLSDDERQWLVFVETPTGSRRIPVYVDAPTSDDLDDFTMVLEDKNKRKIVN